jgi:uncharacterized membrane protein
MYSIRLHVFHVGFQEHRLQQGSQEIFHIEAMVARVRFFFHESVFKFILLLFASLVV